MTLEYSADADGTVRIAVIGQLTVSSRDLFKQAFVDRLDAGTRSFVLDCCAMGYVDHSGLGAIISVAKKIREKQGTFRVEGLNEDLRTLFELTKLDQLVPIVGGAAR